MALPAESPRLRLAWKNSALLLFRATNSVRTLYHQISLPDNSRMWMIDVGLCSGHKAYLKGSDAFKKIVETFGDDVIGEDGGVNRKVLGAKVFASKVASVVNESYFHKVFC